VEHPSSTCEPQSSRTSTPRTMRRNLAVALYRAFADGHWEYVRTVNTWTS